MKTFYTAKDTYTHRLEHGVCARRQHQRRTGADVKDHYCDACSLYLHTIGMFPTI